MLREPYLPRLTTRLADGLLRLPDDFRARHADFVRRCQAPDGGFPGREGGSDLYYTGFALRCLAVLNALTPDVVSRAAGFLRAALGQQVAGAVDFFSLLYSCLLVQLSGGPDLLADAPSDWPQRVADLLQSLRKPDGGYARSPAASGSSTYITFLVGLCYELLGRSLPDPEGVCRFVLTRRRGDGGFVELGPMRKSGTNPTAAAVGLFRLTAAGPEPGWTDEVRQGATDFLAGRQSPMEGGLLANTSIPVADLLSTFTGAWTLAEIDALGRVDAAALLSYARSLEGSDGGFRGGLWDDGSDVEYTFYGLGVVALLTP
jgi:geranylgeranyl transferase type-2 subunit beta